MRLPTAQRMLPKKPGISTHKRPPGGGLGTNSWKTFPRGRISAHSCQQRNGSGQKCTNATTCVAALFRIQILFCDIAFAILSAKSVIFATRRCSVLRTAMCLGLLPSIKASCFAHPLPVHTSTRRVSFRSAVFQMSAASKRNSDIQGSSDPELTGRPMRRKRKVETQALEGNAGAAPATQDNAGTSCPAPEGEVDERPVAKGQPLKEFVENWEFRWDVQRDLYPWEARSRLSAHVFHFVLHRFPASKAVIVTFGVPCSGDKGT